jgi:hypothetical protein
MELRHKCSKGNTLERFLIGRFNPVIGRWTGIFDGADQAKRAHDST